MTWPVDASRGRLIHRLLEAVGSDPEVLTERVLFVVGERDEVPLAARETRAVDPGLDLQHVERQFALPT